MRTIAALFDTFDGAVSAMRSLGEFGIGGEDVALVCARTAVEPAKPGEAAGSHDDGIGRSLPGIGPVVSSGWLLATPADDLASEILDGVPGGLLGALANAGIPEIDSHVMAEGVRRGATLLAVRAEDDAADRVDMQLRKGGSINLDQRRTDLLAEGWLGFEEDAPEAGTDRKAGRTESTASPLN